MEGKGSAMWGRTCWIQLECSFSEETEMEVGERGSSLTVGLKSEFESSDTFSSAIVFGRSWRGRLGEERERVGVRWVIQSPDRR